MEKHIVDETFFHKYYFITSNMIIGDNTIIEPFCNLSISPSNEFKKTIIGDNAIIRSGTYIYENNLIGNNFQTGNKVNIRESNVIGDNVSIGTHSIIEHHIKIGNRVRIHSNVFIPEFSVLDDDCWIGPNVTFSNAKYPQSTNVKDQLLGPHIKKNAIVGAGSNILPGITIGENAIVGAGSVVTKDVDPFTVVIGNPAKKLCMKSELTNDPYNLKLDNLC